MEELIRKEDPDETLETNYSFAVTLEMRKTLRDLYKYEGIDVPEMFRKYARKIIEQAENKSA